MSGEVALNGAVQGLLLLAALLAWPVTWLLLHRYRAQVVRAMHHTSVDRARRAQPSAVPTAAGDGTTAAADPGVPSTAVGTEAVTGGTRESLATIRNRVATRGHREARAAADVASPAHQVAPDVGP